MEQTYGSKFDSQMNANSNTKPDLASKAKTTALGGKVDKVKDFVSENMSGLQDKVSNMDIKLDLKKVLTIAAITGVAIGGVAFFRRGTKAKKILAKGKTMAHKASTAKIARPLKKAISKSSSASSLRA